MQAGQPLDDGPWAVLALVAALVDDAGLFPPAALPMPDALARHRADAERRHPVLTQRFVCPAERLDELRAELGASERITLALIATLEPAAVRAALAAVAADERLTLAAVEGVLPAGPDPAVAALDALAETRPGTDGFVELPLDGAWRDALAVLGAGGRAAKVRCGGARPELVPSPEALGAFVLACAQAGVRFKATAGLHHALRWSDADGTWQHGFLNLLLATARAVGGATLAEVVAVLEETDKGAVVGEVGTLDPFVTQAARALLVSYGSCSTSEPVEDLVALGLADPA
jgi:hypothetical protein